MRLLVSINLTIPNKTRRCQTAFHRFVRTQLCGSATANSHLFYIIFPMVFVLATNFILEIIDGLIFASRCQNINDLVGFNCGIARSLYITT